MNDILKLIKNSKTAKSGIITIVVGILIMTGSQVSDANTGEHRQITFHSPISDTPGVASGKGNLRIKDFNDVAELYWVDELENELRLTEQGELNLGSADIVGTLDNNTWFTAANKDNDGYVNLIKADADDNPIIPLNAELSSTTEPEEDAALICKKYVDDNLTANYSPATYEGGETTTLPNGLIFKMGYKATTSLTGTHTFNSAFPNGIVTVVMTDRGSEGKYEECIVTAQNISGFSWSTVAMTDKTGFNWIAIGY